MSEQAPNPEAQLHQNIQAAQEALHAAGQTPREMQIGPHTELQSLTTDVVFAPVVSVDKDIDTGDTTRVAASSIKTGPTGTYSDYNGVSSPKEGMSYLNVSRHNTETGEHYSHTFKNPDAARRFGSLVAKQVAERADTIADQKRAA